MHILFIHKNYPAQFGHLAHALVRAGIARCTFVTARPDATSRRVEILHYAPRRPSRPSANPMVASFETYMAHSHGVFEALRRAPHIRPDVIIAHSGFGSSAFLPEVTRAPIILYCEWYYRTSGQVLGFGGIPVSDISRIRCRSLNAKLLLDLDASACTYSPTEWQRSQFPEMWQRRMTVLHDGIDTSFWKPQDAIGQPPPLVASRVGARTKIVTYVARGFEPIRGFDVFMKVAKRVYHMHPDVLFVCVGTDRVCYGGKTWPGDCSYREYVLSLDSYDSSKFLFAGRVPPRSLLQLLQCSDAHVYLTMPFVLSWSLLNALATGCAVVASDSPPVREVIGHGRNGLLADLWDVETLAAHVVALLNDGDKFRSLRVAASNELQARFAMESAVPAFMNLCRRAITTGINNDTAI